GNEPVRLALAWLVKAQDSEAWRKTNDGKNGHYGSGKAAVILTSWLLDLYPEFIEFKPELRRRLRDRADYMLVDLKSKFYVNWHQGFAGLYAYERSLRDGKTHPSLDRIARGFIARQDSEGGWFHGIGEPPAEFYSSTLAATCNLALIALGAAKRE